jgi:hypothetical protein
MTDLNSRQIQIAPVFLWILLSLGHYLRLDFHSVDKVSGNPLLILDVNIPTTLS